MFPKVPNYLAQTAPKLPSFPDATVPLVRISLCLCVPLPLKCLIRTYTSEQTHTFHYVEWFLWPRLPFLILTTYRKLRGIVFINIYDPVHLLLQITGERLNGLYIRCGVSGQGLKILEKGKVSVMFCGWHLVLISATVPFHITWFEISHCCVIITSSPLIVLSRAHGWFCYCTSHPLPVYVFFFNHAIPPLCVCFPPCPPCYISLHISTFTLFSIPCPSTHCTTTFHPTLDFQLTLA